MPVTSDAGDRVVVGRQPIVDLRDEVVGFELLYRQVDPDDVRPSSEQMTAEVVLGALSIGVDRLAGDKWIFCNADRGALTGSTPVTLPPHRTFLEVLETVTPDRAVIEGCRDLVARGYRLALDDFIWFDGAEDLLELADVVKIDLRVLDRDDVATLVSRCRPSGVRLLAEKVETAEELAWSRTLGFELFQGYAIEHPSLVHGHHLSPSVLTQVQLAATVLSDDLDFDQLEETLRREPGLVLQLLQLASAGADLGLRREVSSVREALVLLGTSRVRQWIALTILGGRHRPASDGLATALVRARACEVLANERGTGRADVAFTAGLLSALDVLLGVSLDALAERLEVSAELRAAAFDRQGPLGVLVDAVARAQAVEPDGAVDPDATAATARAFTWALPYLQAFGPVTPDR